MTAARYEGSVVVVTGGSRGIGYALARAFLTHGATVIITSRSADDLDAAAALLIAETKAAPGRVHTSAFDVSDGSQVGAAIDRIVDDLGPPDVLINNAGIQARAPLVDMDEAVFRSVVDINLISAFLVSRTVARHMIARGSGAVLNIASVQSSIVRPTTAPYAAAKAGLAGLTRSMCAEWAPLGVRANALAPGYIDTELNTALTADTAFSTWIEGRTPAGRWGTVDDLVGPALWLCSDEARFVNGQTIYVDGGLTAVI